jgi:hypothetical protein
LALYPAKSPPFGVSQQQDIEGESIMSQLNEQELNTAIREVLKRAVADKDFRILAANDSKSAIAKVTGKQLSPSTKIQFIDNFGKSSKVIVIPDPITSGQLAEEELEQVAGGVMTPCGASSCGTTNEMA